MYLLVVGRTLTEKGLVCSASNVHVVPLTSPYLYAVYLVLQMHTLEPSCFVCLNPDAGFLPPCFLPWLSKPFTTYHSMLE
jgi:hypothetical protein